MHQQVSFCSSRGFAISSAQLGFYKQLFLAAIPIKVENKVETVGLINIDSISNEWEKYEFGYKNISNKVGCFLNARITQYDSEVDWYPESCLSLCNDDKHLHWFFVPRSKRITIEFKTLTEEKIKCELDGFSARMFQHEVDHQNGLLVCDLHENLLFGKPRFPYEHYLKNANKSSLDATVCNEIIMDGLKHGSFKMNDKIKLNSKSEKYFASMFEINRLLNEYNNML